MCGDGNVFWNQNGGPEECDEGVNNGAGKAVQGRLQGFNVCGDGDTGPGEQLRRRQQRSAATAATAACKRRGLRQRRASTSARSATTATNDNQDDGCTDAVQALPSCGDGFEQMSLGEECDLANNNSDSGECTIAVQGRRPAATAWSCRANMEECDDGIR